MTAIANHVHPRHHQLVDETFKVLSAYQAMPVRGQPYAPERPPSGASSVSPRAPVSGPALSRSVAARLSAAT
jgi:hypothetical protein